MSPFSARSLCLVASLALLTACSSSSETQKLPVGRECAGDSTRCQSGVCHVVDSATSLCTQICATNDDCPGDMLCDDVPVVGRLCLPTGLGGRCLDDEECPAGHRCDLEASRCYIPVVRDLCAPCTSSLQCPAGGHCARVEASGERYCTTACDGDGACPAGFVCDDVAGAATPQCVPDNEGRTCSAGKGLCSPCRGDSECGDFGDMCVRNLASNERFCGVACTRSTDCADGFSCTDLSGEGQGPFQCVPNSGTCAGYCESDDPEVVRRQCGNGASCDVSARVCQVAIDGRLCAACEDDDTCGAGGTRCVVNNCTDCPYKGQKFCSSSCADGTGNKDDSLCPAGFFCAGLGEAGLSGPWHCVPNSGSCRGGAGELGDDCTAQGAASCKTGVCLGFGAQSVCSSTCSVDGDCGDARFRCCAVTGDNGESFDCTQPPGDQGGVCSPRGGSFGADCSPGQAPCFNGVCLDMGTARLCTTECAGGTSCPDGFSCRTGQRPKGDGTFDQVPVCFPDGGGELGADCSFGPAACESGYCIKKPSGNVCTITCADDPDVCTDGYVCSEQTTVDGETVSVCLPDDL